MAFAAAAAACSDDNPAGPSNELTAAEANDIVGVITQLALQQGFLALSESPAGTASPGEPAAAPAVFSHEVSFTTDCPQGGTVAVAVGLSGATDDETGAVDTELVMTQTHAGCQAPGADTGRSYTLDGAPSVTVSMAVQSEPDTGGFNATAHFGGAVDWSTGDRGGTCSLDLDIAVYGNALTGSGTSTTSGTACGVAIESTVTR